MTAYALTKYSVHGSYEVVLAALETQLETVDNGTTIRYCDMIKRGNEFVGVLLYDA